MNSPEKRDELGGHNLHGGRHKGTGKVTFGSQAEARTAEAIMGQMPTAEDALITPQERFERLERTVAAMVEKATPEQQEAAVKAWKGES